MNLLESHYRGGMRFEPIELFEQGEGVGVGFAPGFYKVFTFENDQVVHLQDCVDRDDALRRLAV